MNTVLGNLWHLLNPCLQILVYWVVFGLVLGTDRGVDNFLPFLAIGIFSFQFMRRVIIQGSKSIIANRGLIQSISLPLATLPMASLASELVAYAFPLLVMLGVAIASGELPTLSWLLVVPIVGLMSMFSLGMAFVTARITFHVRDFTNLLDFLFRMLFYFSGVIFLVDRFVPDPALRHLVNLNPFVDFLYLQRWAVMGMPVAGLAVISAFVWAFGGLLFGYLYFRRREGEYGRE
jgi:teichoic acid transport system permease protein